MSLATLTNTGRAAIVRAIAAQTLHFAWGSGEAAWSGDPEQAHLREILIDKEALNSELGRRFINTVGFVTPDPEGEIAIPIGRLSDGEVETARYSRSEKATPYLFLQVHFDFGDACNQTIREVAVFMGTKVLPELPPGQRYFKPAELEDCGELLAIQRLEPPIVRSQSTRQTFQFVLPI